MFPSRGSIRKVIRNPSKAFSYFLKPRYRRACVTVTSRHPFGTHILDREWDVFVILDTCRVDALRQVAGEYSFINEIERTVSVGGSSPEWMVHTFDRKRERSLRNTAYLTANAWTERVLDDQLEPGNHCSEFQIVKVLRQVGNWNIVRSSEIGHIERIWKYVPDTYKLTDRQDPGSLMPGGAPPQYVTERGISVAREFDYDRLILHYMQPHAPYMGSAIEEQRDLYQYEKQPFDYLRRTGEGQDVWNAYLNELRYVLEDVAVLLNNIDAETVVISADHGEAFGEFNVYNHYSGSLHPKIRFVPWVVTSATDTQSYSPGIEPVEREHASVDETLEALGYKT